jgi:hypothetical protein
VNCLILIASLSLTIAPSETTSGATAANPADAQLQFDPGTPPRQDVIELGAVQDKTTQPSASIFGEEGSRYWTITIAGASDFDEGDAAIASLGFTYFIADNLALDISVNADYVNQDGPNAGGGGFTLLMRYHFWHTADNVFSVYADAGAGMLFTSNDVPANGSSVNFTPQAGLGVSCDVGGGNRFMFGARWFHISNANTYKSNPGRDSGMVYAGLAFPF